MLFAAGSATRWSSLITGRAITAVGIARKGAEQRLAYISVKADSEGPTFYVSLENPPERGSDMPYASAGDHAELSFADAADIVAEHLGLP